MSTDPYAVLEIARTATDAELRAAYRRAVQRHHPDHNGGSAESTRRFEEIQEAYRVIREQRAAGGAGVRGSDGGRGSGAGSRSAAGSSPGGASSARGPSSTDPDLDARLAAMESELAAARDLRDRARRVARDAAAQATGRPKASDEELGYVTTDDSLGAIFSDAASRLSEHLSEARQRADDPPSGSSSGSPRAADRMADVFEDIAARLRGEKRPD